MKPAIPRSVQISMRQFVAELQLKRVLDRWPIDPTSGKKPDGWPGWPEGKSFALVLTHDVDTATGQENCIKLKDLEQRLGFRSSFNFVPERYDVSAEIFEDLMENGFEIGVHGLNHDGKLYNSRRIFLERAAKINHYLKEWGAVGFRSPSMHHNLEWLHELNIEYDSSTFDTDPFEPYSDGTNTIFPFWVNGPSGQKYLEIPYTLPQDFCLFILLKHKTIDLWKEKLAWVACNGGAVVLNVHPDYLAFHNCPRKAEFYPSSFYSDFLKHLIECYRGQYWMALPKDLTKYLRSTF
ncbi:hypothetical protein P9J64_03760 [Deltaproteobacteria bacterium IMCC39524]|nr:hypothetical protein [Deltaproteobacteria bacterium IMCC39524]